MGGMVLETNLMEITTHMEAQSKLEKLETRTGALQQVLKTATSGGQ